MSDKGAAPLVWEAPTLEIAGREYKLRRLGLVDVQKAAKIVASVTGYVDRKAIANVGTMSPEEIGTFALDVIPFAFDEVIDWIAEFLGIPAGVSRERMDALFMEHRRANEVRAEKGEAPLPWNPPSNEGTIRDPNVFPLGSELKVVDALLDHADVDAFFGMVRRVSEKFKAKMKPTPKKRSRGGSTKSKPATDGQTATS